MSDKGLVGTIVTRKRGAETIGRVVESDALERAKENERREFGSEKKYEGLVAVQWYKRDDERLEELVEEQIEKGHKMETVHQTAVHYMDNNYDKGNVGWHKKGALLVVLEASDGE